MNTVQNEILKLKAEKDAVILAHYYAPAQTQAVADYVGDSFYLAKVASGLKNRLVVFCGVGFMAESAKLLNPDKKVIVPDPTADCPMAHMASVERIRELRKEYPDLAVVCYINSTAELKAASDVCVTSSNALKIVGNLESKNIFFIPDKNLGRFVAEKLPEKNIILNDGFCPIHDSLTAEEVAGAKALHPGALVLVHPECREDILETADMIGSTAEMIAFAEKSDKSEFIVCTEEGVAFPLTLKGPKKLFYFPRETFVCPDMKLNTPEKLLSALKNEENEIILSEEIKASALRPLERMLELAR